LYKFDEAYKVFYTQDLYKYNYSVFSWGHPSTAREGRY